MTTDVTPLRDLPLEQLIYTVVELRIVPPKSGAVLASAVKFLDVGLELTEEHRHRATAVLRSHGDDLAAHGLAAPADAQRPAAAGRGQSVSSKSTARAQRRPDGLVGVWPGPYNSRVSAALKVIPGARWDKARSQWTVPATPSAVGAVAEVLPTMRCSPLIDRLLAEHLDAPVTARLLDERFPVPDENWEPWSQSVATMPPWDHQRRALPWLAAGSARLLGVQMGGGKTRIAIAGLERVAAASVLLVCPAKVRGVWPRELRKWATREWHVVNGLEYTRTGRERARSVADRFLEFNDTMRSCMCGQPHMAILNYELLTYGEFADWNLLREIDGEVGDLFDVVVYDEVHRLKSMTGQASKTAHRYQSSIARRWGLTGTPLPQGVQDAGGVFRALDAGYFGTTKTAFETRFLRKGGYENKQVVGIIDPDDFANRFYACSYLPQVELDKPLPLPPVVVDVELEPKARRIYDDLDRDMFAVVEAERDDAAERAVSPPNPAVKLLRLQQAAGGHVVDDDGDVMIISTAKIDTLRELLCDLDEPVIVFVRFSPELDAVKALVEETHDQWRTGVKRRKARRHNDGEIMRGPSSWVDGVEVPGDPLMKTVEVDTWVAPKGPLRTARGRSLVYREISGSRSDGLTRESQLADDVDVCGVQLQAGGTGVDLTRARVVVWYSPGFSVSDFDQARARVDRPGQVRNPLNIFLRATDTKDVETYDALQAGRDVVDELLLGHGLAARGGGDVRASGAMVDTSTAGEAPSVQMPTLPDDLLTRVPYVIATPDTGARGDLAGARASRRQMDSIVEARGGRRVARRGAYATAEEHEAAQEALDIATGDGWGF